MYLKKPLWSEGITAKPSSKSEPKPLSTAVGDLVNSLTQQRVYREVTLALRSGLCDIQAEFSFLRVRGLLKFLRLVAEFDSIINLFSQTQSPPSFRIRAMRSCGIWIIYFGVEPLKITSPSTDFVISLALKDLEGCCLLRPDSAVLAHQHKAIQFL